ncbi:hypothetical protein [Glycomyces sp. MUSA5-2]|uniref:hypothetical protein n=1 Tax=Glycomyces sp. MUSA5-2 TaxID=2053002 RepID=UPI00300A090C
MDAYERDMVDAIVTGRGPEVGADRQFLRRMAAEQLYACKRHGRQLDLKQSVAISLHDKSGKPLQTIVICDEAFDDPHTAEVLAGASADIEIVVHDGRLLWDEPPAADGTDADPGPRL